MFLRVEGEGQNCVPEVQNKKSSLLIIVYHKTHKTHTHTRDNTKKKNITRTINNCGINRKFFFHQIKPSG